MWSISNTCCPPSTPVPRTPARLAATGCHTPRLTQRMTIAASQRREVIAGDRLGMGLQALQLGDHTGAPQPAPETGAAGMGAEPLVGELHYDCLLPVVELQWCLHRWWKRANARRLCRLHHHQWLNGYDSDRLSTLCHLHHQRPTRGVGRGQDCRTSSKIKDIAAMLPVLGEGCASQSRPRSPASVVTVCFANQPRPFARGLQPQHHPKAARRLIGASASAADRQPILRASPIVGLLASAPIGGGVPQRTRIRVQICEGAQAHDQSLHILSIESVFSGWC